MSKSYILKVKDNPDLVREADSKAILNTNQDELHKYRKAREEKIKLNQVVQDSIMMRQELEEIKSLLKQLIGQNK
jgi:hypothetical protein